MVGEHDPGVDAKRRAGTYPTNRIAQRIDCVTKRFEPRSKRLTVKKKVPPGARLRR
jgi:hypothetical protein